MKSETSFHTHKLVKGIDLKATLAAEGKTPEEIQESLGETMKLEGDKLKYFFNALDVASENMDDLAQIQVVSLSEGETVPAKAIKVEEHYYLLSFKKAALAPVLKKNTKDDGPKKGKGKGKGGPKGPKPSPWGISPEEEAAKKAAKVAAAKKKSAEN